MGEGQRGIQFQRLRRLDTRLVAHFAAQKEARGQQVSLGRIGRKPVLGGKRVAGIVVASHIGVAETQHILGIDVGPLHSRVRLLEQRNGVGRMPGAEQAYSVHLHRFAVGGILRHGLGKRIDRLRQLLALIENDASQPLHAGRLRLLRRELIEHRHCLVDPAPSGEILRAFKCGSRGSVGRCRPAPRRSAQTRTPPRKQEELR